MDALSLDPFWVTHPDDESLDETRRTQFEIVPLRSPDRRHIANLQARGTDVGTVRYERVLRGVRNVERLWGRDGNEVPCPLSKQGRVLPETLDLLPTAVLIWLSNKVREASEATPQDQEKSSPQRTGSGAAPAAEEAPPTAPSVATPHSPPSGGSGDATRPQPNGPGNAPVRLAEATGS
jgi:hypothetical protein